MSIAWRGVGIGCALAVCVTGATPVRATDDRVSFPSNDADLTHGAPTALTGLLFRPEGAGPFPAVVLLHGCGGLFNLAGDLARRERFWAETLRGQGYLVLLADSFTPRHVREVCTMREQSVQPGTHRNRDAYGALRYLQGRADVVPARIAVLGWSHGGSTTLATVNRGTRSRPAELPQGDFRVAVAFYPGCTPASHDPKWATAIPLLILIGEKDDWTPAQACRDLEARTRADREPVELVVYPGAYHGFDAPDSPVRVRRGVNFTRGGSATTGTNPEGRADAIRRVTAFLAEKLKP